MSCTLTMWPLCKGLCVRFREVFPRNRPIASVPPMMSTPVPRRVSSGGQMGAARFPVQAIMRPGVSVQQILTTTGKVKDSGKRLGK